MTASLKNIILCADDYAQNEDISCGIIRAIDARRLNALSCLTTSFYWPEASRDLLSRRPQALIGLHFNLTHGFALSDAWKAEYGQTFGGLLGVLQASYFKRLNLDVLKAECAAQLEAFRCALGVEPDFIDGHQHVHQLPQVRDALLAVYQDNQLTGFIRNTARAIHCSKSYIIARLGGITFKHALNSAGITTNTSFSGVYPFHRSRHYRRYFNCFLNHSQNSGLIMCHPGNRSTDKTDPLREYRCDELEYLMSDTFLDDLSLQGASLVKISR